MMIDQNNPGHWMVAGLAFMVLAGIIQGTTEGTEGMGPFLGFIGLGLFVVGIVIVAIRAGTTHKPKDDDGVD